MTKKILIGFNWLAAGLLSWVLLLAAFMPANFINKQDWVQPVVLVTLTLGLLLIINGIRNIVSHLKVRTYHWLLWGIVALIIIIQIWVALNFIDAARGDVYFVRNQAISLAQDNHVWADYFKAYPNNVNSALFEAMLLKVLLGMGIKTPWVILNLFRFAWLDTGLLSGLVLLKHWKHWNPSGLLFALTWLFSLPVYAYGLFAYNDALVMPLVLNVAALGWLFKNKHGWQRWLAALCSWIMLGMGFVMKSNLIVLWIAVIIVWLLALFMKSVRWPLALTWLAGGLIVLGLSSTLMTSMAKQAEYVKDSNLATPVTSWIAMSLNPEQQGQYSGKDFYQIRDAKTKEAKATLANNLIQDRLKTMKTSGLLVHFMDKFGVFLSHGDFDANHLIPQWISAPSWYLNQQRSYQFWALLLAQCWYLALLVGSIWQLFTQREHLLATTLLSLTLLGLMAFHVLIWEVEPRYALPLLPVFMLLGSAGWTNLPALKFSLQRQLLMSWLMVLGLAFSMISIIQTSTTNIIDKATNISSSSTSSTSPIQSKSVLSQGNGGYFDVTTLLIKGKSQYHFSIPVAGLKTNQLVLYSNSKSKVTIRIKAHGEILKQVTKRADLIEYIDYPATRANSLDVTIVNRSRNPVSYASAVSNYSLTTGMITNQPQKTLQWSVNQVDQSKAAETKPVKITPDIVVISALTSYLILILGSIWLQPRYLDHEHSNQH
ncbi:membrane protein [Lactiplantibacillus herbarum]|uniref:membrane protein n=1 Tax=Lactiplantibacillus herbarum TaxID=1670446 RepID=UPI00064F58EE|nr:membrane protein [Lactiplantibacillus herbarum]